MNAQAEQQVIHSEITNVEPSPPTPIVRPNVAPDGDGVYIVVRDGWKIHRLEGRQHHRRIHEFDELHSLADWLNRYAVPRERAEILVDQTCIGAALEPANPIGDVVTCEMPFDPRFALWEPFLTSPFGREEDARPLSQKELSSLLRAGAADVEGEEVAQLLLHEVRNVSLTKGSKRELRLDERGYYRYAASVQNRAIEGAIPPSFSIRVPLFEGVLIPQSEAAHQPGALRADASGQDWAPAIYSLEILLTMDEHPATGELVFTLDAPALPLIARQARRDVAAFLRGLLDPELLVMLGVLRLDAVAAHNTEPSPADLRILGTMVERLTAGQGGGEARGETV